MKNVLFICFIAFLCCNNKVKEEKIKNSIVETKKEYSSFHKEALEYAKQNGFNQDFYYLLDFSIHSGKNRFFVYDFKNNEIKKQKLVTHGSCDQFEENPEKWEKAKFSTKNESHCSMKGKYKIGKRDYSSWGINVKYWIHGLEKTNNTAVKRVVVLHSWDAVKDEEVYPRYSPLSWGCPAVSNEFMKEIDSELQKSTKPVLLWIIE
ncbi:MULTISPECIES: murein L,D-transpeptidase catalytic domain-containing protein [Flavobacterium]|uniref:Murein L,D-transpeptidase catalytic domain-containing protein n=1 Tax=Flavobacterium jumunjinense TaxID=998845 RepID=A0ABV5GKH0_9FLAO|nr:MULTISPECIES: murein L,D-transpeptidase catalytic domain family protein [Flavobacterium]